MWTCIVLATGIVAQTSGRVSSNVCTISSGLCAIDGSSNEVYRALRFDINTGIFTGTITTNQCSNDKWGTKNGVLSGANGHQASCISQTFPAPLYSSGLPKAAPIRGPIGYSITGGINIFGPFEAGFFTGQACTNGLGSCDAGVDLTACDSKLHFECGGANVKHGMLLDDCGGHANPYHYHFDLACDYNKTALGHSALIGIALDGRGIYGQYETSGTKPTNLDSCGGHFGPVPAYTIANNTYPAAENVYHYHTQEKAPYTVGCFGPVISNSECKNLYSTCNNGFTTFSTKLGCYKGYDTDCPCFGTGNETYNQPIPGQCSNAKKSMVNNILFLLFFIML